MIISKRSHLNRLEKERHLAPLIDGFCQSEPEDLAQKLNENMQWNLPQGNLLHWVRVLNLFDDIFERQIAKYDLAAEHPKLREIAADDSALLVACLKFTKVLLEHCTNRSIYSSSERIFSLVMTPCIDVKLAALEVALCLGERYVYGNSQKKFVAPKAVRLRMLEMAKSFPPPVPASFVQSRSEQAEKAAKSGGSKPLNDHYSWVDVLDHKQKYPPKWKALSFDFFKSSREEATKTEPNTEPKAENDPDAEKDPKKGKKKDQESGKDQENEKKKNKKAKKERKQAGAAGHPEEGLANFHLSEDHVKKLSLEQIFDRAVEYLPNYSWFSFSFHALNAKAFNTCLHDSMQLRVKLLRMKCLAIACVACFCNSDFTACHLFEIEPYTLGFMMELVSPDNAAYVPPDLFYTASKTIRAISMKRVWGSEIVRHFSGNVNHGLLYEVLRHINKQVRSDEENTYEEGHKVFLTILGDLVESKTLATRLVAGGLLTELMTFLDVRSTNRWAGSAAVHVLSVLLSTCPEYVGDFADNNGFNLLISSINYEVDFALENPGFAGGAPKVVPVHHTISLKQVKFLRNLLDFVSNLIMSDAGDRLRNLFDSPILAGFKKIVMNPSVFGPAIIATTLDDIAQIIHNEPTAFSILNEAGLIAAVLENYKNLFLPMGELLLSLLEVLGAISLNKDGMTKVIEANVLHTYFLSFYDLELAKESMNTDMPANIGCSMDELGRHNPPLRPLIIKEVIELISKFAPHANEKLNSITFYSSALGFMYSNAAEEVIPFEAGQGEIESWEGSYASNLVDAVYGFLNGLLQDTGQWGKEVIKEVSFGSWESLFTMSNIPFDFTVSNGVLNLVAVLKYLDDEVQAYGFPQILESLSERLKSPGVTSFLENREEQSFFLEVGKSPAAATSLLQELNAINNLLFVVTEIYLNPSSVSNETNQALFEYLENNMEFVDKLVSFLQVSILEETNIRSALPDSVMESTSPSIFYTVKSAALRILPRKPPSELPQEELSSAKFKNTLQLRFLMDSFMNNLSVILSCVAKSCMHRRQDFFSDAWRRTSVIATKQLAISLSEVLRNRRGFTHEKRLEYVLRVIHSISFISTYKDRGKESLSTSFISFFYHTTDLGQQIFDTVGEVFDLVCSLPKDKLKEASGLSFIRNTTASVGLSILNMSLVFILKLTSHSHVNKYPMSSYFFNPEYCSSETDIVNGVVTQSIVQTVNLISRILGTKSRFYETSDYSLVSVFPAGFTESLVNLIRVAWSDQLSNEFYPLREDWMTPAQVEIDFLKNSSDIDEILAREILNHAKSLINISDVSEKPSKIDSIDWVNLINSLKMHDIEALFSYKSVLIEGRDQAATLRDTEDEYIHSVALLQLCAFSSKLEATVALAFQTRAVRWTEPRDVDNVFKSIETASFNVTESNSEPAANLVSLLDRLTSRDSLSMVTDSKVPEHYDAVFERFTKKFLDDVKKEPEIVDTDYFAAGLSFILPLLSQSPPSTFPELPSFYPHLTARDALKVEIANVLLPLEPKENIKSVTLLARCMFLLAKEESFKASIIKSTLLTHIIKNMKRLVESADKENHKSLQDSIILIVRTCFENKDILRNIFSAEITKSMNKHMGVKRELGQLVHESRSLLGRDPDFFLEVASGMLRLDNYDGKPSSSEKLVLWNAADQKSGTLESNSSDVEMEDPENTADPIDSSGLVHTLLSQLMSSAKEDWYSTPEKALKEREKEQENEAARGEKKKDGSEFDFLMENKKFAYMCFLLQTLCELVGSYSGAKLEFITYTKKAHSDSKNKPRLTSLNFFIHQLIPSQSLICSTGPEFHRREAISSLAKLTLLALVSTTVQERDAEPDPRKEDADMAIVRKLMVDIISKILKETVIGNSSVTLVYSKIYDVFDLCSCLLSTKFRELCYPLLSKSATKSDQFYVASAFIDSNLANHITSVISNLDLNFPDVSKVSNVGLKTLSSLAKIKLANADLFETAAPGEREDDDVDEDEEKDETPDLFRNSTLGMYDLDLESDEEEEFYQDQSLVPVSGSDISDGDSDNSDIMSYSDMDSEIEEGEIVEDDEDQEGAYEDFESDDSSNHISYIEDLEIGSANDSDFDNSDAEEFNGFDSEVGDSAEEGSEDEDADEEFYDGEDIEYTEAELDDWEQAFADLPGSSEPSERVRFGDSTADVDNEATRFDFDSDANSDSESDDEANPEGGVQARTTRESIASFFNALRPMGSPILSLNPSGILAGSIQIGSRGTNETSFPQLDAAFQALLNTDAPKSSVDHMLIRSNVERWSSAFAFYFRRFETTFVETARQRLKKLISADSYEIYKKKAEEKEKLRKKKQEINKKKREEALLKREAEEKERISTQDPTETENREPVMLWIGNREVDISGTDIDPEFFQALPEDMREEVFTQHVRERRANASNTGDGVREIDPDFLDALPEQIRNEILQQESMSRRFSNSGFGFFHGEDDDAESDSEMDDEFDDGEDFETAMGDSHEDGGENDDVKEPETQSRKKKSFSVPLIDRSGVASVVKLLFLPRPISQREHTYQALVSICNNKQTSSDVVSMLIAILHDGLSSQKALEKMFVQVTAKAAKGNQQTASRSFPIGCSPISIGVQIIEALLYLLEKTPALRLYMLTEHENVFLTKKHLKKFRLKKTSQLEERYPINLLFRLLDNPLLNEEYLFVDLLSNVFNYATRPLLIMRDASKPTPAAFATNFIPDTNLRSIIKILTSKECVNSTFRSTISSMHHLSLLKNAQNIFSVELSERAAELGDYIIKDLKTLTTALTSQPSAESYDNKLVSKFTASSSDQAKLLRILTALDYMYESQRKDKISKSSEEDYNKLTDLYKHLQLGTLWKALSDGLRIFEENQGISHIATALLPLIEALMVVCKHSKVKDILIKEVMKFEVKKIDFTREPIESLFFSFTEEHKKILNQMVRSNPNLMSGPFSMLVRNPRVLEFDNKRNYFNRQLHDAKQARSKMSISIRRDQVFLDSYRALFFKSVDEFKKAHLEINFKGEAGIDAGGVTREWYQVLSRQMFNPDYALFTPVASDENTYHPNRTSYINPEHLSFFKFIGRTIGKAIYDGCFLDCHFSRAVYKKILDRSMSLKDMENLDLEYFKSLMWMLENNITDIITEDFSVETDDYGEHKIIDLIPDGRNIPVTEENKQEYVQLVVEYRLQTSVSEQMKNFITGFHEIIPRDLVSIFDEQELELLISGLPDIDVHDWQNNTNYSNYSASSEQIQWFWRAVKSFDNEERAKLLQFSTGTSKVPLNGFKDLSGANGVCKFSIHRDYGAKDRLPSSHTCFNQIDLPVYDSYDTLRGSLLLAISEGHEGFQLA